MFDHRLYQVHVAVVRRLKAILRLADFGSVKPFLLLLGSSGPPTWTAKFLPTVEPDSRTTVLAGLFAYHAVSRGTGETMLPPPIRCLELVTAPLAGLGHGVSISIDNFRFLINIFTSHNLKLKSHAPFTLIFTLIIPASANFIHPPLISWLSFRHF